MSAPKSRWGRGLRDPRRWRKCRAYLIGRLEAYGYEVEKDAFEANTPYGPKKMTNLIARKTGSGNKVIALASHYDTKYYETMRFVGANDGGSSTGLLLELARVLAPRKGEFDYWFLFLDGEEAFIDWSTFDSTYGSRHLARRWKADGTVAKVRAAAASGHGRRQEPRPAERLEFHSVVDESDLVHGHGGGLP